MDLNFKVDCSEKVKNSIQEFFDARCEHEAKPCHHGTVIVNGNAGNYGVELIGNLECSCGKKYAEILCSINCSEISLKRV